MNLYPSPSVDQTRGRTNGVRDRAYGYTRFACRNVGLILLEADVLALTKRAGAHTGRCPRTPSELTADCQRGSLTCVFVSFTGLTNNKLDRSYFQVAANAVMVSIWKLRNGVVFEKLKVEVDREFRNIKDLYFLWLNSRCSKFHRELTRWTQCPYSHISYFQVAANAVMVSIWKLRNGVVFEKLKVEVDREFRNIKDLYFLWLNSRCSKFHRELTRWTQCPYSHISYFQVAANAVMVSIWKLRNGVVFEKLKVEVDREFRNIKDLYFLWLNSRCSKFNRELTRWTQCPYSHISYFQVAANAVMVSIWKLRNGVVFEKLKVEVDREFRNIKDLYFLWLNSRCSKFNRELTRWTQCSYSHISYFQVAANAVMVSIWKLRNGVVFEKLKVEVDREFRNIKDLYFLWLNSRCSKFNRELTRWTQCPYSHISYFQVAANAVMVSIWKLRNGVVFEKLKVEVDREFRNIKDLYFLWLNSRCSKFNRELTRWTQCSYSHISYFQVAANAVMVSIWKLRNGVVFEKLKVEVDREFRNIKDLYFLWLNSRCSKFNRELTRWTQCPYSHILELENSGSYSFILHSAVGSATDRTSSKTAVSAADSQ
ncbi:hypothetical protein LXL04_026664 [Taraxacum kok-saghyz]